MREHSIKFYLGSRWDWLLFSASGAQHDGADSGSAAEHSCGQFLEGKVSLGGIDIFVDHVVLQISSLLGRQCVHDAVDTGTSKMF